MLKFYSLSIGKYRYISLLIIIIITAFFASQIPKFSLDASSDSLVLEGNKNLEIYEKIKEKYGSDDYLIITFTPKDNHILDDITLKKIKEINEAISNNKSVKSITSILNVPLIKSPKISLSELTNEKIISLENGNYSNKKDVLDELGNHPIYSNVLISEDEKTTAILVNYTNSEISDIEEVRKILNHYKNFANIFIGGVPMIVADSISYIDSDIKTFGLGVIAFIILLLSISFKKFRWVFIPLINSAVICVIMIGLLGFINWPITVVSSNFISLVLIISISLSIHLIVKYEELLKKRSFSNHQEVILEMIRSKFKPCLYTALTTIVAFISLIISEVKPIIDFGWMMVFGIIISFLIIFSLMPIILTFFPLKQNTKEIKIHKVITGNIFKIAKRYRLFLLFLFGSALIIGFYGISKLSVENRFIDYFKESTEIYQGMKYIDQNLGGTTPADIVISAPKDYQKDEYSSGKDYWYNSFMLEEAEAIHDYLDSLDETGKVLSIASSISLLRELNDGEIDSFLLALVRKKMPKQLQEVLISPYLSNDGNEIRFSIRIYESDKDLKRSELINKIEEDISKNFDISSENIKVNGMLVLYNDLLQSLFRSQILTIGAVFAAIGIMFLIIFKSIKIALIALVPNIVAASSVLGLMGLVGIPLDIMTITIAAICLGIAVDDTIHYVHSFLRRKDSSDDIWEVIRKCHDSVGRAIYLTTITITLGFSILALSNFVPTIYFGLLTGFSMVIALLADLILLPIILSFLHKRKA